MPNLTLLELALVVVLIAASVRDLMERRIPNKLLLAGLCAAAMLHAASGAPVHLLSQFLAGLATGLLLFFPLYLVRGMAAGDVKLMAVVGAFTGPLMALHIALATFCYGGLMALVIVVAKGRLGATIANVKAVLRPLLWRAAGVPLASVPRRLKSVGSMPYGLAIALGSFTMLWLRHA